MKNILAGLVITGLEAMGGFVALLLVNKDASNVTILGFICFSISLICLFLWWMITSYLRHKSTLPKKEN